MAFGLRVDFIKFSDEGLDIALIRHELMARLTRIVKLQKQGRGGVEVIASSWMTYRLFLHAMETGFAKEQSLRYYARPLGYSESTISRACLAAEGKSAKQVIHGESCWKQSACWRTVQLPSHCAKPGLAGRQLGRKLTGRLGHGKDRPLFGSTAGKESSPANDLEVVNQRGRGRST